MSGAVARYRYILDTDIVTYHQLGRADVVRRLARLEVGTVTTTVITVEEQLQGRLAFIHRQRNADTLADGYRFLQTTQQYFCRIPILSFDAAASGVYTRLIGQRLRIGTNDLRIAAITIAHNARLLTRNLRHFEQIPELIIETV